MFTRSTQKSQWLFKEVGELANIRKQANSSFIRRQSQEIGFLTYDEERIILLHYEYLLKQFCGRFQPPITMPRVIGTSITYFKRFYLRNSVMDFHPKDIFLVCVYLACKTEEFNISISQFVQNINSNEDKNDLANVVVSLELLLIEKLDFHLTIHNCYRPFEGFLLDLKTRCSEIISNPEILRAYGMEFLDKILNTDAILLYPPSQIALTAIVYSSSKNKINLDDYCQRILLRDLNKEEVTKQCSIIKRINRLHKEIPVLNTDQIMEIENKLNKCYNTDNDPRSQNFYANGSQALLDED